MYFDQETNACLEAMVRPII